MNSLFNDRFVLKCSTALASVAMVAAMPAQAQSADDEGQFNAGGLTEIIVTAQKRAESSQKAAVAITAVSSDDLARAGVTDAQQLTNLAPALHIDSVYGPAANFYVRGVGNLVLNASSDPAVVVNIDGVPLARPTGVQGMFFDLERVEVLKGPQGTLYGRNATGGAVNVITAQPKIGQTSGSITASYGNYNAVKLDGALNLPVSENTAVRIAGLYSNRDGYYSDGTGDEDLGAFRVSVASDVSDTFTVSASFDYAHQGGKGPGSTAEGLDYNDRIGVLDDRAGADVYERVISPAPYPFNAAGFAALPGAILQPFNEIEGVDSYQDNEFWGVRLQADLETSLGTVSFIPSYREATLDYLSPISPIILSNEKDKQTSAELRLVSPSENQLQYIFGLFYFNERVNSLNNFNFEYTSFHAVIAPKVDSYAAYSRLTYSITPELRISGGLRYTIDKKSTNDLNVVENVYCPGFFDNYEGGPATTCVGTPTLPVSFEVSDPLAYEGVNGSFLDITTNPNRGKETFKKLTWRAAVEYDVAPRSLLYASVETGYKAGGFFNTPDQANNSFQPETIIAYTLGSKNRFLDNRLQLNLEAFWWEYKDQQVSHFITVFGAPVFATENIGKSRFRGVELEMRAQVMSNTEVNGTVQYLDARNTDFLYGSATPPNTGCPSGFGGPGGAPFYVDCTGSRPAKAPEWTLQGGIDQRIPLGETGDITVSLNTRYESGSYTGIELLPSQYQSGFFTSGAQVGFTTADRRFNIAGFVDNIEDNATVGFSQPHNFAGGQLFVRLQAPRTYGVRAGYKF
ncbi:TonB-dependent receptor [Croceicoccus bisphenolivorans]|uniref:TonB-dependent receptor n=1 Tax=Croceicoccus bisphenolivorans TaxID=1783232 RepID=UPI0009ECF791|nr:TonB-dependent receptor [Croceicoccus bisphenolivorans]